MKAIQAEGYLMNSQHLRYQILFGRVFWRTRKGLAAVLAQKG